MSLSHPLPHSLFFAVPPPLLPCGWACRYCGQPELLMAALLLHCPIAVYVRWAGAGPPAARPLRQIQVYGRQWRRRAAMSSSGSPPYLHAQPQ